MSAKDLKNAPITKELETWRKKLKEKADKIRKERALKDKEQKVA